MDAPAKGASPGAERTAKTLRVARLSYLNVLPFFLDGGPEADVVVSPRQLGYEAATGRVDAGPLSLVDAWRLEGEFEPVGPFGIAVRGPARSVLLFSKRPMDALDGAAVGVTDQTSTSVKLLAALLEHRYGVKADLREGFSPTDEARLVIGDDALLPSQDLKAAFPLTFDLGREWYLWRERPFVFARWMVRSSVPTHAKEELRDRLDSSLRRFEKNPAGAVLRAADKYPLPGPQVRNYLTGFVYRLGPGEKEAEDLFRSMTTGAYKGCGC